MSIDAGFNKLSYEHYALYPNDGNRHEIVDGDHFMNPAPNLKHQTISRRLEFQLYQQIELADLGWIFNAPVDVQLTQFDIVQPDLVVVLKDREAILTEQKIDGVPNMVIEILSPRTAAYDRTLKMQLYQRAGVAEYWLVDPTQDKIQQLVLQDQVYVPRTVTDPIPLTIIDGITVDVSRLWD